MKVIDLEISTSECPEQNQHTSESIDRGMHCKNKSCMERETIGLNKEEHAIRVDQCDELQRGKDQQEENCRIMQVIKELMASSNEVIQGTTQMRDIEALLQESQWEERDNNGSAISHPHGVSQKAVQSNNVGLRTLLTRLVLELSHEKENLKLAAAAGNSLLEQLAVIQKEKTAIIKSLDAKTLDYECAQADNARLKKVCEGMEQELRHYDATLGNRNDTTNEIGSLSVVKIGVEGNSFKQDAARVQEHASRQDSPESCKLCERLEAERKLLVTEKERVQRRCLDLEVDQERSQRSWTELNHLCKRNELCLKRVQAEYTKALEDMEYMATQIQCLKEDQRSSGVKRDKLYQTTQKLQTENEMMKTLLEERLGIIQQLRSEKSANVTQAQWYETRVATLTAEKKQLLDVIKQCHERLSYLEEENRERNLLQKQVADLEMLIEEADQKWMHCSQENRSLRTRFSSASEQYADKCFHSSKDFESEQESTAADVLETHTSMQSRNDSKVDGKNLVIVDYQVDEYLECEDTGTSCSEELDCTGGQQVGEELPKIAVCVSRHEVNTNSSLYIGISLIACATALRLYLRK
uniref:Uncharacterized protein AlNc14C203G8751 n=1 Tax=Albugo laibachii Nc14 TaxID=890382 RepID=F0W7X3_9STRA|nr:conserved hypothetical protein [Albugo laibachii Nc14]CCA23701.1 conserved hypothetical protein [Albugo laibachii Nc14]|eukprot:CCA23701.1 conserved hypothetical protein [Albugo laibachii Nc14]